MTGYPFDLPTVRYLGETAGLPIGAGATFLVGENGSGDHLPDRRRPIDTVAYDQALPVTVTREFLARPQHYLRFLVGEH
ncbi:hypothetical protein [Nocardia sp. NPDC051750]|uniref:hypothetical protein n=1 Tax=Nocardia sp. NPDC051750 TaxID=3364325 RepID=UPI0037923481